MSEIRNTSKQMQDNPAAESLLFLAGAMGGGASAPIERQERDGQRELVNSDRLPSEMGDQAPYEALGFTFGPVDEDDPLFRAATLPPGWKREGSDHAMWSYLIDERGRQRVAIFYKAAFYDRRAFMRLESLEWYVTKHVEYDEPLVLDSEWASRDAVIAAMSSHQAAYLTEAEEFRGYASADDGRRDAGYRENCDRIASERAVKAGLYAAKIREMGSGS